MKKQKEKTPVTITLTDEVREELTKNQIARLFTSRVARHFTDSVEMDKEHFFKYMQEASDEMKEYMLGGKKNEKRSK